LPARSLFDHPLDTQFTGDEFRAGLREAGLHIVTWRPWARGPFWDGHAGRCLDRPSLIPSRRPRGGTRQCALQVPP
jgi:hypothetical protein